MSGRTTDDPAAVLIDPGQGTLNPARLSELRRCFGDLVPCVMLYERDHISVDTLVKLTEQGFQHFRAIEDLNAADADTYLYRLLQQYESRRLVQGVRSFFLDQVLRDELQRTHGLLDALDSGVMILVPAFKNQDFLIHSVNDMLEILLEAELRDFEHRTLGELLRSNGVRESVRQALRLDPATTPGALGSQPASGSQPAFERALARRVRRLERFSEARCAALGLMLVRLPGLAAGAPFTASGTDAIHYVLRIAAQTLKSAVRTAGVLCRLSREEFLIAVPGLSVDRLRTLAGRVRDRMREVHVQAYGPLTAHIGAAHSALPLDQPADDPDTELRALSRELAARRDEARMALHRAGEISAKAGRGQTSANAAVLYTRAEGYAELRN